MSDAFARHNRQMDADLRRAGVLPRDKACGCSVGFCRAETLLDALTREVMAGRNRPDLEEAYRAKESECCGGFLLNRNH